MVWKENRENAYCEITPAILALKEQWEKKNYIDPKLYKEYNVKRGLRDEDGRGVLTGLTRVGEIQSYSVTEGEHIVPQDGMLYYRGIDCRELVKGSEGRRFAFEETAYLLLFGELPNDIGLENVLRQCLQLMSNMPVLAIYAYQAWRFSQGESLFIHVPKPELSTAENFLRMLREDCSYTDLEARTLDVALILHADNGGGNNSTFTNHVVTSSGTDTYSAIAASMASLKGPRHGGANSKVMAMMDDVKEHVRDWNDEGCVADYLTRILNKDAFDRSGLIYGLGHAVYTKTDPRCEVFRAYVNHLAAEKGREDELALYANVEKIGKQLLMERQHKSVLSTNIDFYSGFVYEMLGLPKELYTPLFAVARIAGWSAHRMEELSVGGKLIRPRYECVEEHRPYTSMDRR